MLGHTNYAFTAETYVSVVTGQLREAAEGVARFVRGRHDT